MASTCTAADAGVNVQNERPLSLETPTISYINRYIYIRPVWAHSGNTDFDVIALLLLYQMLAFKNKQVRRCCTRADLVTLLWSPPLHLLAVPGFL